MDQTKGLRIQSKEDLRFFLDADKFSLGRKRRRPGYLDYNWKYQILLRKLEYWINVRSGFLGRLVTRYLEIRLRRLALKLGIWAPPNVFGAGLRINHYGYMRVGALANVGMWCDIHMGVNVGANRNSAGERKLPRIGNNVWIGPGAKLYGDIDIGDGCMIAANSAVGKSFEDNTTIGGIPARVLRDVGTADQDVAASVTKMREFFRMFPQYAEYESAHTQSSHSMHEEPDDPTDRSPKGT